MVLTSLMLLCGILLLVMATLTSPLNHLVYTVHQYATLIPGLTQVSGSFIRKSGHAVVYTLYFIVVWQVMKRRSRQVWQALLVVLVVAILDEGLQTLLPTRCGRWQDVLIDMSGAVWLGLSFVLKRRIKS